MRYLTIAMTLLLFFAAACVPAPTGDAVDNEPLANFVPNETSEEPQEVPEAPETPTEEPETPEEPPYFTVRGTEGDLIELSPEAIDPDGDRVTFEFSDPFTKGGRWQTQIGDEGRYHVSVEASDGKDTTLETILIIVDRANRAPIVDCNDVTVKEGESINLHDHCRISDEDDEEVVVTYRGWMSSWRYTTTYDDAGKHTVIVTASDKRDNEILHTVVKNVTVTVKDVNRAPVFLDSFPEVIRATERDVVTIPRDFVDDPDNDDVKVTFSDPFDNKGVWKTDLGDAGEYTIDVVASDGKSTAKRTVRVEIALLNTAPTLKTIPDIEVDEGETIRLPISATDREGDTLTVKITGWMDSREYTTTYDDAGEYTTKVTVSDGVHTTSQIVHIKVNDVNRPPVFVTPA